MTYFGAFAYHTGSSAAKLEVYETTEGHQLPGAHEKTVHRHHNNLVRSGSNGFPKDYYFMALKIRARINVPLADPVLFFVSSVAVEFSVHNKVCFKGNLYDLLDGCAINVEILENVNFRMWVEPQDEQALFEFKKYLTTLDRDMTGWILLDGMGTKPVV